MDKLRVLIVSHGHPEISAGGAEIASHLLFTELQRHAGIDATYLAWIDDVADRPASPPFGPFRGRPREFVFFADGFDRFRFSQPAADVAAGFAAFLRRVAPDVVHFHHYTNIGLELLAVARRHTPVLRVIVTLHEYLAICHHHGVMVRRNDGALCAAAEDAACGRCFADVPASAFAERRRAIQAAFAKVDLFVAPSAFLRGRYVAWGLPAWQIVVLDNGIPPTRAPPPRPLAVGARRAVFGYFGQIHPFKGLLQLLTAFDHLPDDATDIRLVIHGAYLEENHPAWVAAFRELLARHAARVRFAGPYARAEQSRLMAELDWVVVPSIWWENSPLVIQEALAHRRPVICSDIGGMAEKVRPGLDGFHVRAGDPAALAALFARVAADPAIWWQLHDSIGRPESVAESAAAHLALYRDRSFSFAAES